MKKNKLLSPDKFFLHTVETTGKLEKNILKKCTSTANGFNFINVKTIGK